MNWQPVIAAMADTQRAQLLAVAGFVMLGWVLARRTLGMRKRVNRDSRAAGKELEKLRSRKDPVLPLSDAPVETQRWQVGLFNLQRELKAELDTRIVIVQSLLRQVDAKIQRLSELEKSLPIGGAQIPAAAQIPVVSAHRADIEKLVLGGHTAEEISATIGMPLGDVELTIATMRVG